MATPHVAGAVALMVSSNPGLEHDDLKFLLEDTAVDLGDPGKDNVYGTGRVDAYEAVLRTVSSDGVMSIKEKEVACEDTLSLSVSDMDLQGAGTVDGVIQVTGGDVITATYIDADDGEGGTNVPKTDTADVDCKEPVISNVRDEDVDLDSATIHWQTDEPATSIVEYGPTTPPDQTEQEPGYTTNHDVTLTRLEECTIYYYRVRSADSLDNEAVDDNNGQYYYFETLGDFGNGPQSCHAGQVTIQSDVYSCSDSVTFEVSDLDLNTDPDVAETTTLQVTSTTETEPEIVTATETEPNSSTFSGSIATATGTPVADGVLQLADTDVITVTYLDADDGTGRPATSFDTASADCREPAISDLVVDTITDARATISWQTDEPADAVVEWGTTPELGETVTRDELTTDHSIVLNDLDGCGEFYFRVQSTDTYGYTEIADAEGEPFHFNSGRIPGLYYKAEFEQDTGEWELEGEWEIGQPQGLGGSSGSSDPLQAYNNDGVLGVDLSGQGSHAGDYEPDVTWDAFSPVLDASAWTNLELIYFRQLKTGSDDEASLWLWTDAGRPLYRSEGTVNERSYQRISLDISSASGSPSLQFEFRQKSNDSSQYAGWNVDEFILKDGSQPDYAACGGCGGTPSFDGATDALDNDACGADGVTVSWEEAVSWGTGGGGSYAVYRGTSPGFEPSASNRIASGVTGLSYNDADAPTDQDLYYLVRAESDETCGSGPNNGGMMDGNMVYAKATETTSQPAPGTITEVAVDVVGHAHVRLSWPAASHATSYRVYRSESPEPESFTEIGETTDLFYEDVSAAGDKKTYYYDVRAVNACGAEGD
jgi:hypothetical protein